MLKLIISKAKKIHYIKMQNEAAIFEDLAVKNKLGNGLYVLGTSVPLLSY